MRLLDVLLSTETSPKKKCQILEKDFRIKMTQTLESEVSVMCNLSKGVEEKGIEKGIKIGIEQGMEQGIEQGMEQGMEQGIRSIMINMIQQGFTIEQIMAACNTSQEEIEACKESLIQDM